MTRLYSLTIKHYRGIEDFETTFGDENLVVIIGRGDSGKTTILKAIAAVMSPNWNMGFNDWDFYKCDTSIPIVIEATLKDLPQELLRDDKYGLCLSFLSTEGKIIHNIEDVEAEEADKYQKLLTLRLIVSDNLEPKWQIISGANMDIETDMPASDRAKLKMFQVSDFVDSHFNYSKGSPLYTLFREKITDKSSPEKKTVEMVRKSYKAIEETNSFSEFEQVTTQIKESGKTLGLSLDELKTLFEFRENAYSESKITLFSDNIPYKLHGKGSKRLLSIAIQQGLISDGGVVLIDELEQGLEPDRARNLTHLLKNSTSGQFFITTHSRDVLAEASTCNVYLMKKGGEKLLTFGEKCQAVLRAHPEAFFAKKIICCEGKTEVGIIRALDDHLVKEKSFGLACFGATYLDSGGGNKFYDYLKKFKENGYEACVFADDDNADIAKDKKECKKLGMKVILCDEDKAIEEQLFIDIPWSIISDFIEYAVETKGHDNIFPLCEYVSSEVIQGITDKAKQLEIRKECGRRAKSEGWYKRIDHGEKIGCFMFDNIDAFAPDCTIKKEYDELVKWIMDDLS